MWQEVKRAFALTFNQENFAGMARGKSSLGWLADPYLRKGMIFAIPFFLGGIFGLCTILPNLTKRESVAGFALLFFVALFANIVWFGVAAASRARAERNGLDGP